MKTLQMTEHNNELYLGDYKLSDLAKEYKTPLYVYDEKNIRLKLDIFKNNFQSKNYECKIVYASKAFFCPYLASIISEYHMGIDAVSSGDLYMIHRSNFNMQDVVYHGNNKSEDDLKYANSLNCGLIVCDNFTEIKNIEKLKLKQDILLRVNPGIDAHTHQYIQTSLLNSKFGESIYDVNNICDIVNFCKNSSYVNLLGFHSHIGSSINQAKSFKDATRVMLDFMRDIEDKCDYKFHTLNLGGGFGIKYNDDDASIDLEEMMHSITKEIDECNDKYHLNIKRVMIEPGRSIVGDAGITLYTAGLTKKTFGGLNYLFVDGGMTDNIRPALYQAKYSVDNASCVYGPKEKYDIVGPCCESGDIVSKDVIVTKPKVGDTIVTYCTGAYGYSMSSNYNGHVRGSVIFVNKDKIRVGIMREDYNDLCSHFPSTSSVLKHRIWDCHSDMLYDLWTKKTRGIKDEFKNYHVNQLSNSVIKGSIWTMYSEFEFDLIEACKIALSEIKMDELKDFEVILGLEGLRNLKRIEDLDVLYDMGFRHAMVTWNEENKYATGAKSNPERGFTEEGYKLLDKMEEKDMIIDLAHLNEKSFYDAINHVHKNIIYSHGNCKALCKHPRNVTDDQMRALKAKDGLLGLTLADNFIAEAKEERTMERFLEHVKHAINIMGIDNVCFGFDFMDYLSEFPNCNLTDVKDATLAYRIIEGLQSIGLTDEEIDKITYDNFYRRFKDKVVLRGK